MKFRHAMAFAKADGIDGPKLTEIGGPEPTAIDGPEPTAIDGIVTKGADSGSDFGCIGVA